MRAPVRRRCCYATPMTAAVKEARAMAWIARIRSILEHGPTPADVEAATATLAAPAPQFALPFARPFDPNPP